MKFMFCGAVALLLCIAAGAGSAQASQPKSSALIDDLFTTGPVSSFLLLQDDRLLFEEYRGRMHAGRPVNIKSASKSILSLLIGIAIEKGYLRSVDQTIGEFFPDFFEVHPDVVKASITIQDLLTMRAGLASTSRANYGAWVISDNWVDYVLSRALVETPGEEMVYSTGSSHLLSVILTRASGMSTREFARRYLFGPLKISIGGWDRDPQGYYMGGNNLALSPSALLKIGIMVMNRGVYQGRRIVPADWIDESMQIYTRSHFNPYDYGYLWWQRELEGHTVLFAWGNGGQYIFMIPSLRAVAVVTSSPAKRAFDRANRNRLFDFIEAHLISYLKQNPRHL